MPNAKNAKIEIEVGQTYNGYTQMSDSGDETLFTVSGGTIWSGKSGSEPTVRPDGVVSGRQMLAATSTNNQVSIAAFTAYLKGVLTSISATYATFTRQGTDDVSCIFSVQLLSDGSLDIVQGTVGADTSFCETRNTAGGPPYIPLAAIELGQIRVTANDDAKVTSSEIFQVVGQHTERYDFPGWSENNIGKGIKADSSAEENAHIEFASALPESHTGGVTKNVWISYYEPIWAELEKAMDFVPVENTHSVSSTEYYRGTTASASSSLGQGAFTVLVNDGISDTIVAEQNEVITVRMYPDEDKTPYMLTQGYLGIASQFPAADQIQLSCTISAEAETAKFTS